MSGTSADGVDAVATNLVGHAPQLDVDVLSHVHEPFDAEMRTRVLALPDAKPAEVALMNVSLGEAFARATQRALEAAQIDASAVTAVASPGLTVAHLPPSDTCAGATLAIGDGDVIAERTGCDVLSDFRARDRAAGGHGAPLVPFADAVLLGNATPRAALNIGGIANVTFTSPSNSSLPDVRAFDTGPGNMVLDAAVAWRTDGSKQYDDGGALGLRGHVDDDVLAALDDGYFDMAPPKSTGRERYGAAFLECHRDGLAALTLEDMAATLAAFTVRGIVRAVEDHAPARPDDLVVSGGGAFNACLMEGLRRELDAIDVTTSDERLGIPALAKECVAFAILAAASCDGVPSALPSVTGAARPTVLGKLSRRA